MNIEPQDQPKARQGHRSARGAKSAYDWEAAIVEAAILIFEHGLPETQADLVAHISDWFGDNGPGDSQIKEHLAPLYQRAKQAFGR